MYAMAVWLNFGNTLDEAYDNIKKWGTKFDEDDITRAVRPHLEQINSFSWKGLWLVAGKRREST